MVTTNRRHSLNAALDRAVDWRSKPHHFNDLCQRANFSGPRHTAREAEDAFPVFLSKGDRLMAYVVCEPCCDCKYTDCVVVCPCDCFYQDDRQLFIDPVECIDCGACEPECPVEAIFAEAHVPSKWTQFVQLNATRVTALKENGHITERQA